MTSRNNALLTVWCALILSVAGCGQGEVQVQEPLLVFPDAEPLANRHRNHSMVEAPGGQVRVFAGQAGDETDLMVMRKLADGWSKPVALALPRRDTNTSPRFDARGTLYYASDAPHPERPGRKDLNIWRVTLDGDIAGKPEVLPDAINTGSSEDGFAPFGDGQAVFASTTLGGVGGFDLYLAQAVGEDWAIELLPHNTQMADAQPVVTPDGNTIIWYSHLPTEKVYGSVDLFMSQRDGEGWSAPINLGPIINTAGIDYGPGLSADGKRFFFSRDGVLMETSLQSVINNAGFTQRDSSR